MKYEMFISSITSYYAKNNLIGESQIEAFKYGASLTFASIVSFAIAFSWGAVFNCIPEVCVFLVFFVPLRIFTGGYHASTFLRCTLSLVAILALLTLSINYLPDVIIKPMFVLGSISFLYSVYRYSPIQHPNAPIRERDIPKFRKISLIICILEVSTIAFTVFNPVLIKNYRSLIITSVFSMIIGSFLIYIAKATINKTGE